MGGNSETVNTIALLLEIPHSGLETGILVLGEEDMGICLPKLKVAPFLQKGHIDIIVIAEYRWIITIEIPMFQEINGLRKQGQRN